MEKKRKRSYSRTSSSGSSSSSDSEEEQEEEKLKEETKEEEKPEDVKENIETVDDDSKPEKPKALHKTTSIFLRNLAPTITRQEVEAICSR